MDDSFPPVDSATLPPSEDKRLRNSHPLYSRMNGEVIWMAYEELGFEADACAAAMDAELDLRRRMTDVMATLEQRPDACCLLELPPEPCADCSGCRRLALLAVDAATPHWQGWLPPYAIGCRARCRLVTRAEAEQANCRFPAGLRPPRRQMVCPCLAPAKG